MKDNRTAVAEACRLIKCSDTPPKLAALAKSVGMSPYHFHRVFTKTVGLTPKAYASAYRAERMREILPRRGSVTEAMYESGFNSSSRFYEKSSEILGMRPKVFRNGGSGTTIRFAVGECSLGSVLIAATQRGVCAILLGDHPDELVRDLQRRFRNANLIGGDGDFEKLVARAVGFIEQPRTICNLPLDIRGTAFQQKVWLALRKIPAGKTVSYAEIAARIGLPKSVRAVAGAIAANPIAVAIPCHRVIRTDGSLSGYRWGVARKRALLLKERAVAVCFAKPACADPATQRLGPKTQRLDSTGKKCIWPNKIRPLNDSAAEPPPAERIRLRPLTETCSRRDFPCLGRTKVSLEWSNWLESPEMGGSWQIAGATTNLGSSPNRLCPRKESAPVMVDFALQGHNI